MATNWPKIFAVIMITTLILSAEAKDFGVVGHTYEILEQDIIEYIKAKLASVDIGKLQTEQQAKLKAAVERPSVVPGIIDAKEEREYYFDPSFTLDQDIFDHNHLLMQKAGTKINPLEQVSLNEDLVFINGDNEKQIEFAINHYKSKKEKVKIILVKGSPSEVMKRHMIWIYFDQAGVLTSKFGIIAVPAIVTEDKLQLKINEIKL